MSRNQTGREPEDVRSTKRLHHAERDGRKGNALPLWGLIESGVHLGRGIATVLTMVAAVTVRVAMHGITALHRLLGGGHAKTVESVRRESEGQCREKDPLSWPHQGSRLVVFDERVKARCVQSASRIGTPHLAWSRATRQPLGEMSTSPANVCQCRGCASIARRRPRRLGEGVLFPRL
jgi:hypothetical protein